MVSFVSCFTCIGIVFKFQAESTIVDLDDAPSAKQRKGNLGECIRRAFGKPMELPGNTSLRRQEDKNMLQYFIHVGYIVIYGYEYM